MKSAPCFIIAEAGVNHNGDETVALSLVRAAKEAGADAVKFQTFRAELLATPGSPKAEYQRRETGEGDQLSMLKSLELPHSSYERIVAHCQELDIEFMSTPFDETSAKFLVSLGMRRIKVPSGELTNHPFLEHISAFGLPIILSTGMGTIEEVEEAVQVIASTRQSRGFTEPLAEHLTVLHCTSNYPAVPEDVNLRAMQTLSARFGVPVGYSDHSSGTAIAVAAVAMGASVIEKHFTLDRRMPGPDHRASLEQHDLARMIADIRGVEVALGDGLKVPRPSELPVRQLVRRSVMVIRNVSAGQELSSEHLALLRPGTGIPPKDLVKVLGRRVKHDLAAGTMLSWDHLV